MVSDDQSTDSAKTNLPPTSERRFAPGFWAKVLGVASAGEAVLTPSSLTLVDASRSSSLTPAECLGDVQRRRGLFWNTLVIHAPTGPIRIRGLSSAAARDWEGALNKWLEPVRLAALEPLRALLRESARRSETTWSGHHYVRASEHQGTVQAVEHALSQLSGSRWDEWCTDDDRSLERGLRAAIREAGPHRLAINDAVTQRAVAAFKDLFDSIESNALTDAQQRACVMADDNNLVLAGAGTGKTSVVLGRIAYLIASGTATPREILAVAYNGVPLILLPKVPVAGTRISREISGVTSPGY